jgi:polygalacturonase
MAHYRRSLIILLVLVLSFRAAGAPPLPQIQSQTFKITDHGANGDGSTLNTDAITKTITACKSAGGGTIVIPAGRFLSGPFELFSKMNLHLDDGATLIFTDSPDAYPIQEKRHRHAIWADQCTDISITGKGVIDGQGGKWWEKYRKRDGKDPGASLPRRPNLIDLNRCTRVLVQDVKLQNSACFHLVPRACSDVTIKGVSFSAPDDSPNTDGLDPSGWNYLITECTFDVGDDCIAVKPQAPTGDPKRLSCEDIVITRCTFKHGHGLSIGGQTPGGLRRMTVRDCTFELTDAGIRMKAARGSGGLVEDITYDNITMKNVKTAIFITSYYPDLEKYPHQQRQSRGRRRSRADVWAAGNATREYHLQ